MGSGSKQTKTLLNEPLARHTSFRVGGPARYFNIVENDDDLKDSLEFAGKNGLDWFVIGTGTNLLVSDEGFDGMMIKLAGEFCDIDIKDDRIDAGAAVSLSSLARIATRQGLKGLEFAVGIPGSVGGGLIMNAGAYGGSIGDAVESVIIYTPKVELKSMSREDIDFQYRSSSLAGCGIITRATFRLQPDDAERLKKEADRVVAQRKKCQPGEARTAGSVFKNPSEGKAGVLIETAGCKGMRVNGAVVSEKHANFVINEGSATAADIYRLIQNVKSKVKQKTGVELKEEILLIGKF